MARRPRSSSQPKFPYTTAPAALRKLLREIPKKPKPDKMMRSTLGSWGISNDANASTAITVLKKIGLLGSSGEPNEVYKEFMKQGVGPKALAQRVKDTYRALFENSLSPQTDSDEQLRNLFNIHSGGGEDTMRLQMQTFKALCEHADFSGLPNGGMTPGAGRDAGEGRPTAGVPSDDPTLPPVKIDLHIHLPENKTARDYEAIIQDIAKYIYGRANGSRG